MGANVGHYTKRFSELVGKTGRVIAFEPVPTTFSLLSANTNLFVHPNTTLFNAAVSDKLGIVGMDIPIFSNGLPNYYEAHLNTNKDNALSVLTISLDSLEINQRIAHVKIDAEGHEASVLGGMEEIMIEYHPTLIVENPSNKTCDKLIAMGYMSEILPNSPNVLFKPKV